MPETGKDDCNRGCITMTAADAEEFNQELAKSAFASGSDTYMFVPVYAPGVMKSTFRGSKCPSLTTNSSGGPPTRPHGTSSGSSRRRESGAPRERKRPAEGDAEVASSSQVARPSMGVHRSKRPKLPAQPPRASSGGDGTLGSKTQAVRKVIMELIRHPFALPFANPVDPSLYPDYYTKVLNPIDLGTIKKQLDAGVYRDVEQVKEDVARVWENCAIFNPADSDIVKSSRVLAGVFNEKMNAIPDETVIREQETSKSLKQHKIMQRKMQQQLEEMKALLEQQKKDMAMQRQQQLFGMAGAPLVASPMMQPAAVGRTARGGGPSKRKAAAANPYAGGAAGAMVLAEPPIDDSRDMTFEEKSQLSAGINKLRSDNLVKVVQIIRTNMPSLSDADGEIEVDINALDRKTLWELHRYVNACLNKNKAKTKKAPTQTTASRTLQAQQAQALSEQRIAQLQQSLAASSGGGGIAGQNGDDFAHGDSASYSDSEGDLTVGASGVGGGGYYDGFAQSKAQSDRDRQEAERKRQEAERQAAERRRQKEEQEKARIQRERAAARAANEGGGGGIDMLGQSNMMASFEGGADTFDFPLDEYGET